MSRLFVFGREDKDNVWYSGDKPYSYFSFREMKKMGLILYDYGKRYICKAQPMYTYMQDHLILRPVENYKWWEICNAMDLSVEHLKQLTSIFDIRNREGYHVYINPLEYRSVKKYHIHLCKCKILEKVKESVA